LVTVTLSRLHNSTVEPVFKRRVLTTRRHPQAAHVADPRRQQVNRSGTTTFDLNLNTNPELWLVGTVSRRLTDAYRTVTEWAFCSFAIRIPDLVVGPEPGLTLLTAAAIVGSGGGFAPGRM